MSLFQIKQDKIKRLQREIKQQKEHEERYANDHTEDDEVTEEVKQEMEEDGFTMVTDKKNKRKNKK